MTTTIQKTALVFAGIGLACGLHWLQGDLDQARAARPEMQEFMYLPPGDQLKAASLGFEHEVADLLWIEAIQVMGDKKVSEKAGRWLFHALDVITTLDPMFVHVYEVGGIVLTTMVVLPEESNRLLEKGMAHNPEVWKLPFLIGFNHYFELSDDVKAAEYLARASKLSGAPAYLAPFAARLYASSHEPQLALEFLAQTYDHTVDENVRAVLEQRIKEVTVERDLQLLEQAIGRFYERYRFYPARLDELEAGGMLRPIPLEPFGGVYEYDRVSHSVHSSSMKERLKTRGHRRVS